LGSGFGVGIRDLALHLGLGVGFQLRERPRGYRKVVVDEDPDVIVAREFEFAKTVVLESLL